MNHLPRSCGHRRRITSRAQYESHISIGKLNYRPVRHRPGFLVQILMLRIADDADDFIRHCPTGDTLAERVFIREILPGQCFIDDDDIAFLAHLLYGEETAAYEWDLQSAEEVIIGDTNARRVLRLAWRRLRAAFDAKTFLRTQSEEWSMVDRACRFDSGQGLYSFDSLREEADDLGVLVIAGAR